MKIRPSRQRSLSGRATSTCLLVALVLSGRTAEAVDEQPNPKPEAAPTWTLQVDPLTTAIGSVHLQVERALADSLSIYVGPSLRLFPSLLDAEEDKEEFLGLGVEAGVRWFVLGGAPEGFWLQLRGVGATISADVDGQQERAFGGYVSALAGYTWIADNGFLLSGGAGGQYLHYRVADLGPKMFFIALHTTVGFAF